ncbi:MAG: DNA-binding protein [Christensenellales bacterium]
MELINKVHFNELIDEYGVLLTEKQQRITENYCLYDLSITEIATEFNMTRQAVFDCIQKSVKQLEAYESLLNKVTNKNDVIKFIKTLNITEEDKQKLIEQVKGI